MSWPKICTKCRQSAVFVNSLCFQCFRRKTPDPKTVHRCPRADWIAILQVMRECVVPEDWSFRLTDQQAAMAIEAWRLEEMLIDEHCGCVDCHHINKQIKPEGGT